MTPEQINEMRRLWKEAQPFFRGDISRLPQAAEYTEKARDALPGAIKEIIRLRTENEELKSALEMVGRRPILL